AVLKAEAPLPQAQAELASLQARFHAAYPSDYPIRARLRFTMVNARDEMTARAKPILYLLLATALFLVIAAIANVANLSLSRQMRRGRELALRVALGAGQRRLYRQLSFESLLLTLAGGVFGVRRGTHRPQPHRTRAGRRRHRCYKCAHGAPLAQLHEIQYARQNARHGRSPHAASRWPAGRVGRGDGKHVAAQCAAAIRDRVSDRWHLGERCVEGAPRRRDRGEPGLLPRRRYSADSRTRLHDGRPGHGRAAGARQRPAGKGILERSRSDRDAY